VTRLGGIAPWHYGSIHWPYLFTGPEPVNVPAVFQLRFNWRREIDQICIYAAGSARALAALWRGGIGGRASDADVSAKWLFNTIFGVMLLISGIAIGIQTRRSDRRALVRLWTPWIMFFLWPVQIQERYLLYGRRRGGRVLHRGEASARGAAGFASDPF